MIRKAAFPPHRSDLPPSKIGRLLATDPPTDPTTFFAQPEARQAASFTDEAIDCRDPAHLIVRVNHQGFTILVERARMRLPTKRRLKMNNRLAFEIVCPHNHNQTVKFTKDEFEAVLKSGTLVFHCNTCETNWSPSSEEIATFRKQFAKDSS